MSAGGKAAGSDCVAMTSNFQVLGKRKKKAAAQWRLCVFVCNLNLTNDH